MKCSTCIGMGFVSIERRETRTVRIYRKGDGSNCWQHEAASSELETFPTGRMVTVSEICDDCHGCGLIPHPDFDPDCTLCAGMGTMTVSDGCGGVDFDVCICKVTVESEAA